MLSKKKVSPLYIVSERGHTEVAKLLLEDGAAQVDLLSKEKVSPLYIASERGHTEVAKTLLENGAQVDFGFGSARLHLLHLEATRMLDLADSTSSRV